MFVNCTSLTSALELPATTLASQCYAYMFQNCTSLNYISVGFTSWPSYATTDWVNGVSSAGTFVKPTALSEEYGSSNIPDGWTVENY